MGIGKEAPPNWFILFLLIQAGATVPFLKMFLMFLKVGGILYGSGYVFVAVLNPLIPKLRKSGFKSAFQDAVNISSVTIILTVAFNMGRPH